MSADLNEREWESVMCERLTPEMYKKVRKARVAVAGLGGLGSNIAMMLARTGIGCLHLVDFDRVDLSNLNRQQYAIRHLGCYKTEALREQLMEVCAFTEIITDNVRITKNNVLTLFEEDEIVCESLDQAESKAMLTEKLLESWKGKAIIASSGMAGYGSSNEIRTQKISRNFYLCGDCTSDIEQNMGITAPRVMLCAAHQANMVLRLIMGETKV